MSRDFNGTSDYLDCSAGVLTTFPFSISAWVKPTTLTGSDREIFSSYDNPAVANALRLQTITGDSNKGNIWLYDGDYNSGARTSAGLSTGSWQNVIVIATSSTAYAVYLNNGSSGSDTVATSISLSAMNRMTVGRASFAASEYFSGKIGYLAVWNNYGLSSQDRTDLQTKSPLLLATQPTLHLAMDANQSPETDTGTGGNNFTVNGATYSTDNPTLELSAGSAFQARRMRGNRPLFGRGY